MDIILQQKLYLPGNYLKMVRSKNISTKQFQIIDFDVTVPPDETFKTFVKVLSDLVMSTKCYLALCEFAK